MTDIQQSTSGSYSFTSAKYWCANCQRQFSQLKVDSALSATNCPRCNSLCQEVPPNFHAFPSRPSNQQTTRNSYANNQNRQNNNSNFTQANRGPSGTGFAQASRPTNGARAQSNTRRNINGNSTNNNYYQSRQRAHQPQRNDIFSNLFGEFGHGFDPFFGTSNFNIPHNGFSPFGIEPVANGHVYAPDYVYSPADFGPDVNSYAQYGYGANVDESVIEAFLRDDPNEYGPPPASEASINKLQKIKFDQNEDAEVKTCPICQENYNQGEPLLRLPCKHDYHGECINGWLNKHNSCPMCRKAI